MDGIKDLKNLALKAIEKRSSLLKNEKYILWKIKKNWTQIVNGPIGEKTYPKSLFNGNLVVVINDGIIYHTTIMYAENIKEKIKILTSHAAKRTMSTTTASASRYICNGSTP